MAHTGPLSLIWKDCGVSNTWGFGIAPSCEGKLEYSTLPLDECGSSHQYSKEIMLNEIDSPTGANRDERKLRVDGNFDSSSRLLVIIRARFFVGMNLLPLLHPFGHLHVMYACALPP
jgi:hypothetical protein